MPVAHLSSEAVILLFVPSKQHRRVRVNQKLIDPHRSESKRIDFEAEKKPGVSPKWSRGKRRRALLAKIKK